MPRPSVRAERVPQIIQAAMTVFGRNGFAQTRMDDIAQEAGLSKAALYLYFASKEEVIGAILETFFAHGFLELDELRLSERPVVESLVDWTRRRMHAMQAEAAFASIGFEFHAVAARQEATREVMRQYYERYRTRIAELVQTGIARGELRPTDPHETAVAIVSVYEGLTALWMLEPEAVDLSGIAERTIRKLLVV